MAETQFANPITVDSAAALPKMTSPAKVTVDIKKENSIARGAIEDAKAEARQRASLPGHVPIVNNTMVTLNTTLQGMALGAATELLTGGLKKPNETNVEMNRYPSGATVKFKGDGGSFVKFFVGQADGLNINKETKHNTSGQLGLPAGVHMAFVEGGIRDKTGKEIVPQNSFVFIKDGVPMKGKDGNVLSVNLPYSPSELDSQDPINLRRKNALGRGTDFEERHYSSAINQLAVVKQELNAGPSTSLPPRPQGAPASNTPDLETRNVIPPNSEKSKKFTMDPVVHKELISLFSEHLDPKAAVKLTIVGPNEGKMAPTERQLTFTKTSTVGEEKIDVTKITVDLDKFTKGDPAEIARIKNAYKALLMDNFEAPKK